jgi:PhoH-like ATPase
MLAFHPGKDASTMQEALKSDVPGTELKRGGAAGRAGSQRNTGNGHTPPNGAADQRTGVANVAQTRTSAKQIPDADEGVKHFVLDTNVLLHNPNALFVFKEHEVIIPLTVIEELDKMKRKDDDLGRNARECIRHLDRLRAVGKLTDGVDWGAVSPRAGQASSAGNGKTGRIRIDVIDHPRPLGLKEDAPDHRIIAVAYALKQAGINAVFVSKDMGARIKSDALGIRTEDFANQKVDADRLYTGYINITCEGSLIDELYKDRLLEMNRLEPLLIDVDETGSEFHRDVQSNQFVVLKDAGDENHTGLGRRLADTDHVIPVTGPRKPVFGIMHRNVQQLMALDLLMDDEVRLITLVGSAGTGKTLLAIAAGMAKVFSEERYDKLLVARPIMPMGRDIGYLPGDKDEKLTAWMQPVFDNLGYLLSTRGAPSPGRREPLDRAAHSKADGRRQARARTIDLHPRPLDPAPVHDRGRSPKPHAARGQDDRQPRGRGHQAHPDGRHRPDRQSVPRLIEQRPVVRHREDEGRAPVRPCHPRQERAKRTGEHRGEQVVVQPPADRLRSIA